MPVYTRTRRKLKVFEIHVIQRRVMRGKVYCAICLHGPSKLPLQQSLIYMLLIVAKHSRNSSNHRRDKTNGPYVAEPDKMTAVLFGIPLIVQVIITHMKYRNM